MDVIGTIVGTEYLVGKHLGGGGMAQVYLATSNRDGSVVAVKIMSAELTRKKKALDRFQQEARIQCKLNHPNLVHGIATGIHEGTPYLVMEYVDGPMLSDLIRKRGSLSPQESIKILLDISLALNNIFMEGSIKAHRDIKPQNIMLAPDGTAKLTDFGIAKALDAEEGMTLTSSFLGSPHYMSPEQIYDPRNADIRSDIYALGAVFYEMITGLKAFTGQSTKEILDSHCELEPPSISGAGPLIPACNDIFVKTMAYEKTDRFQTPRALIEALAPISDEAVSITVPKFSKSTIQFVIAVAALIVVIVVGVAIIGNALPKGDAQPAAAASTTTPSGSGVKFVPTKTTEVAPAAPKAKKSFGIKLKNVTPSGSSSGSGGAGGAKTDPNAIDQLNSN